MKIILILTTLLLASCGGGDTAAPTDPADTATWSDWTQWSPADNSDTSVINITQTRTRSCNVSVNGSADSPVPTCSGSTEQTQTENQNAVNPLAADTAQWSEWTPPNSPDTNTVFIDQTRTCKLTVNGNADTPAPTCDGFISESSQTRTIVNPLSPEADTAEWGEWTQWSPADDTDTSVINLVQTRTRDCEININGNEDMPPPSCDGSSSETKTITNPLAADTATWSNWSEWTPDASSYTDTSVIYIVQTRSRMCNLTIIGSTDTITPICSTGFSSGQTQSETQSVTNTLAADTASWSAWGEWTPANNPDTTVIMIDQTRTRSCDIIVYGNKDEQEPICSGSTSETRTTFNPLVIPNAIAPANTTTLAEDSNTTITLNGTNVDGTAGTFTYQIATHPTNGTVVLNNNIATYTPNADYNGADSFAFTVTGGNINFTSLPAIVNITVTPVNDAPVVSDLLFAFNQDANTTTISLVASDIEGNTLSYSVTNPHIGVLSGTAPNLSYFQDGKVATSFTFMVSDGSLSNSAIVTIVNRTLTVASNSATSIVLSWASGDYFKLYRVNASNDTTLIYEGTNQQYTDNNLNTTTSYSYQIVYCADTNNCESIVTRLDTATAPTIPTLSAVTALSRSEIQLSWDAVAGASIYRIYRSTAISGTYVETGLTTNTTAIDTGLNASTQYYYQIAACTLDNNTDSAGTSCSNSSAQGNATTTTQPETTASYSLNFNNSDTQVELTWTTTGTNFVRISVSTATDTGFTEIYSGTDTSYIHTNLAATTGYYYRLQLCGDSNSSSCYSLGSVSSQQTATVPYIPIFAERDASKDFDTLSGASNNSPRAIYSDGTTMWVADSTADKLFAYNLGNKARNANKDFDTLSGASNNLPSGLWSDGITIWVSDWGDDKIYAYNVATKARDANKDFDTLSTASNNSPYGLWSDGITMWVSDYTDNKIYAYNLATKLRDSSKDFNSLAGAGNTSPGELWSDGTTMWVVDYASSNDKIYAYNLATKARDSSKDFNSLIAAGNTSLSGIWSDGTTMWASDFNTDKIYAYNLSFLLIDTATALSTTQIELSWKAIAGASIYRVYRSTEVNGIYTQLNPVASTGTTDSGLDAGTSYYYQIVACTLDNTVDGAGTSCSDRNNPAAKAIGTTMPDSDASYNLAVNNNSSNNQINLSWTTTGTNFVRISASTATDTGFNAIYSGTGTSFVHTNLADATGYYYRLQLCTNSVDSCFDLDTVSSSQQVATLPNIYDFSNYGQRNSSSDFNSLDGAGNDLPTGITSDGATMWVADYTDNKIYAYNLATMNRDSSKDFEAADLAFDNPLGIWTNGTTMWVARNSGTNSAVYAYTIATKNRDISKDFTTATLNVDGNNNPEAIYSDGTTMWVADTDDSKIYAYDLATNARDSSKDFDSLPDAGNNDPRGMWSDGTTMWVADISDDKVYAYSVATKARDSNKDLETLNGANNNDPYGIWSAGSTMWIADLNDKKIYAYDLSFISAATAQSSTQIALSWDAIAGASIYRIYRSTEVDGAYTQLNPVASTGTTDSGLDAGTSYYYQIVACTLDNTVDGAGTSCIDRNHPAAQASTMTMTTGAKVLATTDNQYNSPVQPVLPVLPMLGLGSLPFNSEASVYSPVFITENSEQTSAVANNSVTEQSALALVTLANQQCLKQGNNYWLPPTVNGDALDQNHLYRWGTEVYGDWDYAIDTVNSSNLCGFNDWRVPTADELQQLYTDASNFSTLQSLIPNILAQPYWSSTSDDSNTAQAINLSNGIQATLSRYSYQRLILIRKGGR